MTYVFYDTETTGTDTSFDQILQFAAIRTDADLNELERFELRCRLLPHVIPAPRALLTTGVTLEILTDESLPSHYEAICKIADKLENWSPAIFVGYNSMQFDERLLRQAFYQNLKPIYLTNTGYNRRADILKLVDAMIACAPNSIAVPLSDKGRITRRLDAIAPANGFNHQDAHDALADVEATIYMARLVLERAPELWTSVMATSAKDTAISALLHNGAVALVECPYGRHNVLPVIGCGQNPTNGSQVGVFDLRQDPAPLFDLTVEDLITTMKAAKSPVRIVQANAQPIALPLCQAAFSVIKDAPSRSEATERSIAIQKNKAFQARVGEAIAGRYPDKTPSEFVEERIYDDFPSLDDARLAKAFHQTSWTARRALLDKMGDERLRELGFRLLAHEANDELTPDEQAQFCSWQEGRRLGPAPPRKFRTIPQAIAECLDDLKCACDDERARLQEILSWLRARSK